MIKLLREEIKDKEAELAYLKEQPVGGQSVVATLTEPFKAHLKGTKLRLKPFVTVDKQG